MMQDPEFRERHRRRKAAYRKAHPEKCALAKKKWLHSSPEGRRKAAERTKLWREKNKEKFLEQRKLHYERNKHGPVGERIERWKTANVEKINLGARERHRRANPGPAIRTLATKLKLGRIDLHSAVAQIRQLTDEVNDESRRIGERLHSDGSCGAGESIGGDSADAGEPIKGT